MEILFAVTVIMIVIEAAAVYSIIKHVKQIGSRFNLHMDSIIDNDEISEKINIYQEKILEL